jgi:hypothetical protein
MTGRNKIIADKSQWVRQTLDLVQGADRDLGYMQPGYSKYTVSRQVPGYLLPGAVFIEHSHMAA